MTIYLHAMFQVTGNKQKSQRSKTDPSNYAPFSVILHIAKILVIELLSVTDFTTRDLSE